MHIDAHYRASVGLNTKYEPRLDLFVHPAKGISDFSFLLSKLCKKKKSKKLFIKWMCACIMYSSDYKIPLSCKIIVRNSLFALSFAIERTTNLRKDKSENCRERRRSIRERKHRYRSCILVGQRVFRDFGKERKREKKKKIKKKTRSPSENCTGESAVLDLVTHTL